MLNSFRAMLLQATGGQRYYDQLWGNGLVHANKMVNVAPWCDGKSPYEIRTGKKYEFNNKEDHVFGAKVVYYVPKELREVKWTTPGQEAIWVGRSTVTPDAHLVVPIVWEGGSNRYVLGKTVVSSKVDVDDTKFPLRMGPVTDDGLTDFESFMEAYHHQMYGNEKDFSSYQTDDGCDPVMEVEKVKSHKGKGKKVKYLIKWKGYEEMTWEPLKHLTGCKEAIQEYWTQVKKPKASVAYDNKYRAYVAHEDTNDHAKAIQYLIRSEKVDGDVSQWMQGYVHELNEVRRRRLEVLTDKQVKDMHTKGIKPVRMRMRLEHKKDGRRKGRLIIQGFREPASWDRLGTDSPVAALSTIRTLIFMAGNKGDSISSIDVSTAFLQADEYPNDMEPRYVYYQPYPGADKQYYRLKGCLYGQRTSGMEWYNTLKKWLCDDMGFEHGDNDPCIFINKHTGLKLVTVVDDILLRGDMKQSEMFYKEFENRFQLKDPTYLTVDTPIRYVGFDIVMQEKSGKRYVSIDQDDDIRRFLGGIDIPSIYKVNNPMVDRHYALKDTTVLQGDDITWYRSMIGALNYYSCATRYDISYAVSRLSQFNTKPTEGAKKAVYKVLQYLSCNSEFPIIGKCGGSHDEVECYSDSDHAGDKGIDCRSQTGIFVLLNGVPVHWRSVKQVSTAVSSACAEIYALSDAVKSVRLYRYRAMELGMSVPLPLQVRVDNTQAKAFSKGTCVNSKLGGTFDVREQWVKELKNKSEVAVQYVNTTNNIADLLTKTHRTHRFQQLLSMVGDRQYGRMAKDRALKVIACHSQCLMAN